MMRKPSWTISHSVGLVAAMLLALGLWSSTSSGSALDLLPSMPLPFELSAAEAPPFATFSALVAAPAPELRVPGRDAASYLRTLPFGAAIGSAAARHDIDPLLLASIVEVESNFRPAAVSEKGAMGLMQVMPVHLEEGDEPFEPEANLELGATFLASLRERFAGDLALTLAAYHAGAGAVERHGGLPPYRSTRAYVTRVLEIYREHCAEVSADGGLPRPAA